MFQNPDRENEKLRLEMNITKTTIMINSNQTLINNINEYIILYNQFVMERSIPKLRRIDLTRNRDIRNKIKFKDALTAHHDFEMKLDRPPSEIPG